MRSQYVVRSSLLSGFTLRTFFVHHNGNWWYWLPAVLLQSAIDEVVGTSSRRQELKYALRTPLQCLQLAGDGGMAY